MKKNGNQAFTLIEIIAIMLIISTILAITVPLVSNLINSSYSKAYQIGLTSMKEAASGYILKINVEVTEGAQSRIELSDMINEGLMDTIVDPQSKEECTGYVTVTLLNDGYSFTPYLNCGSNYKSEDYDKTDFVLPVIALLGDNPITINVGETYKEPGFTATDDVDGDVISRVIVTGSINPNVPGTYEMTYSVKDNANNLYETTRTVNVIDDQAPIVAFEPNGNSGYAKTGSTVVRVRDNAVLNNSSLKYHWVNGTAIPTESCFITTFTNDATITTPSSVTGNYYLWILAKDLVGNIAITKSNIFYLDNTRPLITLNGSNPVNINVGSTYTDAGAIATDANSGLNGSVTATGTVNTSVAGTYTIAYNVSDLAGNVALTVTRTVNVIDNVLPTVAFGMNGNATYGKSRSTTVTVSDAHTGVNTSSLKYLWNTSTIAPTEASFTATFTNGGTLSTPTVVTGGYYLWILAKDNAGNTLIARTNVFNLDNTMPIITMSGSSPVTVIVGGTYTDAGATATDEHSGISGSVTATSTVNTSVLGTYTVTYNVSDNAGNTKSETRIVNVISSVYTYEYTGVAQTFTVPATGNYKLEVWGAQGGGTYGGKGGYATGTKNLTAGQVLNIYVGGAGGTIGWNDGYCVYDYSVGGFNGGSATRGYFRTGGGGGATDIRLGDSALTSRIIVAGGGGGQGTDTGNPDGSSWRYGGGAGGGLVGGDGWHPDSTHGYGTGGTQTAGGNYGGTLGSGAGDWTGWSGGGGGGGYYGGGANNGGDGTYYIGAGGGSGYVGGVTSGSMETGVRAGNGTAKITYLSQ